MHQTSPFKAQKSKIFSAEETQSPPQTLPPVGRGHLLFKPSPHTFGASILALTGRTRLASAIVLEAYDASALGTPNSPPSHTFWIRPWLQPSPLLQLHGVLINRVTAKEKRLSSVTLPKKRCRDSTYLARASCMPLGLLCSACVNFVLKYIL